MNSFTIRRESRTGSLTKTLALTTGFALALGLAGCSSSEDKSTDSLTFWISTSAEQQQGYDDLAKEYKEETGTSVKIVNIPYDGYFTKLRSAAQADDLPDVARVSALDPIWTKATVDLADIAGDADNNIDQDLIAKNADGKVVGIPSDVTASGMFINKSLFDEAGVDYPTDPDDTWTWDEFIDATTKVREEAGAKYNLTFDASPSRFRAFQYQMGGEAIQYKDGNVSTGEDTTDIYDDFKDMNDDVIMPKSVWTSGADPNALFKSGQVAAYYSGVWQIADFADSISDFDWAAVPSPAQPVHATDLNYGGVNVAFDNGDAEAQAAHDFVAWMYEPDHYTELAETNGFLPVESGLDLDYPFDSQVALDGFDLYNEELELADPISSSFAQAQSQWVLAGKSLADDPTVDEMGTFINGQQDAEKTLKNILKGYKKQIGGE